MIYGGDASFNNLYVNRDMSAQDVSVNRLYVNKDIVHKMFLLTNFTLIKI